MRFILFFDNIRLADTALVGGKNASLGELQYALADTGLSVPPGFAVTAQAYWHHIEYNGLLNHLKGIRNSLPVNYSLQELADCSRALRACINQAPLPSDLVDELKQAYSTLSSHMGKHNLDVAVRSSATAEDLPQASFAGQQETYLHISGFEALSQAYKNCLSSLFTERALVYRQEQNFNDFEVALSVGVQAMVQADDATSGVMFTLDTESGYKDAVIISATYGLGEALVQGLVIPDEYRVHKPTLLQGYASIVSKECGSKTEKITAQGRVSVPESQRTIFVLADQDIIQLARAACAIELHYTSVYKTWSPMDIEWAQDESGAFYIVQARRETIHSNVSSLMYEQYVLQADEKIVLVTGQSIGKKIAVGTVVVVKNPQDVAEVNPGDIVVTEMTDPDWLPLLRHAAGLITDKGGRTCHAAIVSRELGIPALVGTGNATSLLHSGQKITIDCSQGWQGFVYQGDVPFKKISFTVDELEQKIANCGTDILVNSALPETAYAMSLLPVDGVGLARLEFIIAHHIGVHPMAAASFEVLSDENLKKKLLQKAYAYTTVRDYYVWTLAQAVGTICAAFYPRPVIVRLTDFKTNEYRNLCGGSLYEPNEENPMLGFRGAARYVSPSYAPAFALECEALRIVRNQFGLKNMKIMVPFVRTIYEAQKTVELLKQYGLERGSDGLELYMMVELPSNVILLHEFAYFFDGFSIGSNDLTQLTLGVDRDGLLAQSYDERDQAVLEMLKIALHKARELSMPIGICGQAPSDFPEIARFLIDQGVTSLSLNADSVVSFLYSF